MILLYIILSLVDHNHTSSYVMTQTKMVECLMLEYVWHFSVAAGSQNIIICI